MKTIIIKESDFNINDYYSVKEFNRKLRRIKEPFSVSFDFPITKIPTKLFCDTKLAKIALPSSVTSIDNYAFSFCTSLTSITMPNYVFTISYAAFYGCKSLTKYQYQIQSQK